MDIYRDLGIEPIINAAGTLTGGEGLIAAGAANDGPNTEVGRQLLTGKGEAR